MARDDAIQTRINLLSRQGERLSMEAGALSSLVEDMLGEQRALPDKRGDGN